MILRLLLTAFIRIFSVLYEIFLSFLIRTPSETDRLRVRLERELETAASYEDWKGTARRLDELNGFGEWREQSNEYFDAELARQRLETLKALHAADNVWGLMHHLRADLHRGIGGVWNPKMHLYHTGSKRFIEEYLEDVEKMLHHLLHHPQIPSKEKYTFFTDLSATYGHSALVLSGAAALGIYHIGTVQALYQQNLLPRIISGTNTGAMVAAIVCTHHDHELLKLAEFEKAEDGINFDVFKNRDKIGDTIGRRLRRFLDQGVLMDVTVLKEFLRSNIGDMTFIESYQKTNRVLNIVCSEYVDGTKTFWAMNYLTAPHVTIWSAACASCAVPGIYEHIDLVAKNNVGELQTYYPAVMKWGGAGSTTANERGAWERLSELFNINYFILSETNLNVIPMLSSRYEGFLNTAWEVFREEASHRISQLIKLGFLPQNAEVLASLFSRPFEGDVEIFPASSLADCLRLLTNPDAKSVAHCAKLGAKRTWPKINPIRLLCCIERTLEQCTRTAKKSLIEEDPNHLAFYTEELSPEVLGTL